MSAVACGAQDQCAPTFTNCDFIGNCAGDYGGGIRVGFDSGPILNNCTIVGNTVEQSGGVGAGFASAADFDVEPPRQSALHNCILFDNEYGYSNPPTKGRQIALIPAAEPGCDPPASCVQPLIVDYSDSGGGRHAVYFPSYVPANQQSTYLTWSTATNLDEDPFDDPAGTDTIFGTADDNLVPVPGSSCIDGANSAYVGTDGNDVDLDLVLTEKVPWDVRRGNRFLRGAPDIGAYESDVCSGDFDLDGDVDGTDLSTLLSEWGLCDSPCQFDLDGGSAVDSADLAILLGQWGSCSGFMSMSAPDGEGAAMTPLGLASLLGFESLEELVAWLDGLDFETMSNVLEAILGG